MTKTFRGDDCSYLEWLQTHPNGFVVNLHRVQDPNYVVLHRATCPTISNTKHAPGAYTERAYIKACAETVAELAAVARVQGRADGSFSKRCGRCRA